MLRDSRESERELICAGRTLRMGTWYRVSAKHRPAYRKNPFLFCDTRLKLIHSENLEDKELTKAA